jgi:hypothetical protein
LIYPAFKNALSALALAVASLFLWRVAFFSSDWAVLALIPLAFVMIVGFWPLMLDPWRARLNLYLRAGSPLRKILTGRIRAICLSSIFTFVAVILMAWQALSASIFEAAIMLTAFFLAACIFSVAQHLLLRHFHQPFARSFASLLATWIVALPFTVVIAVSTWSWAVIPGAILDASLQDALQIGLDELPARGGMIAGILSVPYGYESAKLWVVVQLRDYPIVGALFSFDAALFSFVLCRSAVVITQCIEIHILKVHET